MNKIYNDIESDDLKYLNSGLQYIPACLFFKDLECRYVYCSQTWNVVDVPSDNPNWSIKGKTDLDIRKDKDNAKRAIEEDKKILSTQKGTSYVIKTNLDGEERYYNITKNPSYDNEGNLIGIVGLVIDVTEREMLKNQLENVAFKDKLTNSLNRHYLDRWIEINKDNDIYPLSVVMADCNYLKNVNDTYGHDVGDIYICNAASVLKRGLKERDFLIRYGGDEFLVIMPNTNEGMLTYYLNEVKKNSSITFADNIPLSLSVGSTCAYDNSMSIEELIKIADKDMYIEKEFTHSKSKKRIRE